MDLHHLELFNTIARFQSYKKASDCLHISQPALSAQIKKLEAQIGLKLFDKIGNRIYLSENGVMLYTYTKRIFGVIDELEDAILDIRNLIGGTLQIGGSNTPGTYILPEIMGEFKKQYPTCQFNLHIGNTSEISHLVNNGTLDLAINGGNSSYPDHIYAEKVYQDLLILVASPQNPFCQQTTISINDLQSMSFVVHKTDSQLYTSYIDFINEINIPENVTMYLGNIDAIKRAVSSNLGVTLLPYMAARFELQYGLLKQLHIDYKQPTYTYNLIYNKNKALSPTSKRFIEMVRMNMSEKYSPKTL